MKGFKDSVKVATPNSYPLDSLSHQINTSFDFYQFRPVFCEEMYPTDHYKVSIRDYFRADPMAGASYANMYRKYAAFFVPDRILWNKWNDFLTGGSSGRLEFSFPHVEFSDFVNISHGIYDYIKNNLTSREYFNYTAVYRNMLDYWSDLGVPIDQLFQQYDTDRYSDDGMEFQVPLLRFLACRRIWFDWFRDQNLIGDDVERIYCPNDFTSYVDGKVRQSSILDDYEFFTPSIDTLLSPLPVAVEKDYFTTQLLEPQRGGAAFVPVRLADMDVNPGFDPTVILSGSAGGLLGVNNSGNKVGFLQQNASAYGIKSNSNDILGLFDYNLSRVAKGTQMWLEKNGVAGGADLQQLLAHWGTSPNPAVFQRSTYLGSFTDNINLTEVTSPMDSSDSRAGEVMTKMNTGARGSFEYTANEHGFFIIVMIARPENTYVGGFRREVLHGCLGNGRFDFFTPELEKTGMQPAYNWEKTSRVFLVPDDELQEQFTFGAVTGYVPRYAEIKRSFNRYTGQMATQLYQYNRVCRDFYDTILKEDNDLVNNTEFTMVYGYPDSLPYDKFFSNEQPFLDHFNGWIRFDVSGSSPRHEYAAPLIEDVKGDDISLPYAGVRM